MPTVTWPTLNRKPTRQSWELRSLTQVHESPLNGSVQTQELPGARWASSIVFESVAHPDDRAALMSFAAQLRGRAGRVQVRNWGARARGTLGGTPLVDGGAQTGASLATDGWSVGATVRAGDFFAVAGEFKMVTADATADGVGAMTLTFEPPLHASPADNAALTFVAPTVLMMPVADGVAWSYEAGGVMTFVFDLIEVL